MPTPVESTLYRQHRMVRMRPLSIRAVMCLLALIAGACAVSLPGAGYAASARAFLAEDSTPPRITDIFPAGGAQDVPLTTNVEATFSEELDASTVTTSTFTLGKLHSGTLLPATTSYISGAVKAVIEPAADLEPGTWYQATVWDGIKDLAGNPMEGVWSWAFRTAAPPDNAPPEVTLTAPVAGAKVRGWVDLTATAMDDVAVDRVEFFVNGAPMSSDASAPYGVAWNSATVPDGAVTLSARALDTSSKQSDLSVVTVTVDNTAPTVSLTAPVAGAFLRGAVSLSATATDNIGIAGVEFRVDGVLLKTATAAPYSATWDTTGTNGARVITARAYDTAGNSVVTPERTVIVDNLAPVMTKAPLATFATPSQVGTTTTPETLPAKIEWLARDSGSGINRYILHESRDGGKTWTNVALPRWLSTSTTRNLSPGAAAYKYRVLAYDKAGNVRISTGATFKVYPYQETSTVADATGGKITYTTGWTQVAIQGAYGGQVRHASRSGSKATYTFNGRGVAWVSTGGADRGIAEVYEINPVTGASTRLATIDLYSSSLSPRRVVFARSWTSAAARTIEVRLLGQKNTASTGARVDIDAFVALR